MQCQTKTYKSFSESQNGRNIAMIAGKSIQNSRELSLTLEHEKRTLKISQGAKTESDVLIFSSPSLHFLKHYRECQSDVGTLPNIPSLNAPSF